MKNLLIHNFNNAQTHLELESGEYVELKETTTKKPPVNDRLYNFSLKGETVQNGVPTLDEPTEIKNVKSPVEIVVNDNYNIWDAEWMFETISKMTTSSNLVYEEKDGRRCVKFRSPNADIRNYEFRFGFKPNTRYYIQREQLHDGETTGVSMNIRYKGYPSVADTYISSISGAWQVVSAFSTAGQTIDRIIVSYGTSTWTYFNLDSFQITEVQSTAEIPPYRAYKGNRTAFDIRDIDNNLHELCGLPSGADEIKDGKIIPKIKVFKNPTTALWHTATANAERIQIRDDANKWSNQPENPHYDMYCNIIPVGGAAPNTVHYYKRPTRSYFLISLPLGTLSSLDNIGAQAWLNAQLLKGDIIFQYPYGDISLPEPIDLHPDEIEKLNNIKSIQYFSNIYTNSDTPPTMSFLARKLGNKAKELQNFYLLNGEQLLLSNDEPLEIYL